MITLREWINKITRINDNERWAILSLNVPKRSMVRDTFFGPMATKIPDEILIAETEKELVLKNSQEVEEWLK